MKTDQELIDFWKDQPAPLLPLLHTFNDRDKFISEKAIKKISKGLKIPIAELYGTITFYHYFSLKPSDHARVCGGPVCAFKRTPKIAEDLDTTRVSCPGRCDDGVPVFIGDQLLIGDQFGNLESKKSPLPSPNQGEIEECIFAKIRDDDQSTFDGYGYHSVKKAISEMSSDQIISVIDQSGLVGRGGAGFPTGRKWRAVADADRDPKTIVCNADEGEPGCFKDRAILDHNPHAVIEGMLIAAIATGATRGFIYLRYEYPETFNILENAINETRSNRLIGSKILGSDFSFEIYLRRGAGAYICGEETALLNSLEGKRPFPRNRPPFPVTHGFEDLPTVVNNVETLAAVPQIISRGAEWYRSLGVNGNAGTKIISLSGDIQNPGNYEIPIGLPLKTLIYDWAGGIPNGRSIQAVTMAGISGGFIAGDDLDVNLDQKSLQKKGTYLGAGGIIVFDETRNMIELARNAMSFFAEESCGKCFPCRIGTQRLTERLEIGSDLDFQIWLSEVRDIGRIMQKLSACGLGTAAPLITESLIRYFPEQIKNFLDLSPRFVVRKDLP